MDYGLVSRSSQARKCLLRQCQPYHRRPGAELQPADARRPHPAQGDQRRFVPVRAQLLPALPTGGTHAPPGRYWYGGSDDRRATEATRLRRRPVRQEPPRRQGRVPADQFPDFRERFGPRGVIHSWADGRIEDTGALTKKRMETADAEFLEAALV